MLCWFLIRKEERDSRPSWGYIVRFIGQNSHQGYKHGEADSDVGKHQGETSPHCKHTPSARFLLFKRK